ncbi:hypothetical protein H8E07_11280 [bacterium]|nr:hypothetical protein [bacterium]
MKNWKCAFAAVAVLAFASLSVAQPTIGVYFDEAGTNLDYAVELLPDMCTGYVMIKDADMLVGGAAFSVDIDPDLMYSWSPMTDQGLYLGDESGCEVGLYSFIPVFDPTDTALLATFNFYSPTSVLGGTITVGAHPNYDAPKVADSGGVQYDAEGLTSSLTIHSTPKISVYFDEAGTEPALVTNGGVGVIHQAYILVSNAEMLVGGAAFKLELDPLIMLGNAVHADALVLGSLTTGVEMGLYSYLPVFGGNVGLLYSLDLMTFDNLMTDAPLTITSHPAYGAPMVADNNAYQFDSDGGVAYLTIVIPTDEKAWGDVKSLYR